MGRLAVMHLVAFAFGMFLGLLVIVHAAPQAPVTTVCSLDPTCRPA